MALGFIVAVIVANMIVRSFSKSDSEKTGGKKAGSNKESNVIRPFPDKAKAEAPSEDDPTEKLVKLKQLHDSGVLTDEEFSEAKAKVLEDI
jgi:membrane protease subunit (stomatin/prohibitin family)